MDTPQKQPPRIGSPIPVNEEDRQPEVIQECITKILQSVGENPDREGLKKTPKRVADAYMFLTSGYTTNLEGREILIIHNQQN